VRLADATRSSLRELLVAELAAAGARARAAGCPPEVLTEVLGARVRSAADEARAPDSRGPDPPDGP
jgi:hypothetical protein